jgi:sugar-specific transcriptional regulator TrmB
LSKEWMLKTLTALGFTETDAQVYVFLTTEGPQQAKDIAEALRIYKRKLYRGLRKLQKKGLVNANQEHPSQFSAVSFDKILDLLIKTHLKEAQRIEQEKEEILNQWHSIINKQSPS